MKKWKLIKKYPGSKELGTIVSNHKDPYYLYDNPGSYSSFYIHISEVENYKEFWEEIVEKNYQILSYISKDGKDIFQHPLPDWTNKDYWYIKSVKRASDGEIFSIGDFIKLYKGVTIIESLDIVNNTIVIKGKLDQSLVYEYKEYAQLKSNLNWLKSCLSITLKNAVKARQVLFTTEDGVNILEGDNFYLVTKELDLKYWEASKMESYSANISYLKSKKVFSTKEAAEEYILLNKPCLSYKEVMQFSTTFESIPLKDLVKSKLNL